MSPYNKLPFIFVTYFSIGISINVEVKVRRTLRKAMLKKRTPPGRLEHAVEREYQPLRVGASTSNRFPS